MKKPGFDWQQHESAGQFLFDARNRLLTLYCDLSRAYPKSSQAVRTAKRALGALDGLRTELDNRVCSENRDLDNATRIYYRSAGRSEPER